MILAIGPPYLSSVNRRFGNFKSVSSHSKANLPFYWDDDDEDQRMDI